MKREFPLVRSFHNLVWNLRHYRHPARRPTFRATRHPFCTNIQLQNALCTFWLKETSKDFGSRLVSALAEPGASCKSHQTKQISTRLTKLHPAALYTPYGVLKRHEVEQQENEKESMKLKMISLFQKGMFKEMNVLIQEYRKKGLTLPADVLDDMVENIRKDAYGIGEDQDPIYKADIETPWYIGKNNLKAAAQFGEVYPQIPKFYEAFQSIKNKNPHNCSLKSLENGIWLCYHMDDADTLQLLLYAYLQKPAYNSMTLSYAVNSFVVSYDVQFAKSLFQSILQMGKPLESHLLSTTMANLIKVGAVFENIDQLFQLWLKSSNCSPPDVTTTALVLKHYLKFGLDEEVNGLSKVISKLGYNNHYLISMVKTHSEIQSRNTDQKKQLNQEDISQILLIRNSIAYNRSALSIYYESTVAFLARHAHTSMIHFIVEEMKKDGIEPSKFAYDVIIQHYISERKFMPLFSLMSNSLANSTEFRPHYVKYLFDAFVRAYPYLGADMYHGLHAWLQKPENTLDLGTKKRILMACRIAKVESNITPYALQRDDLKNDRKYDSPEWSSIKHTLLNKLKAKDKQQVTFRVNKGFRDVLRKGVKPDFHLLENTLRKLKHHYRIGILDSLNQMRMTSCKPRLQILHETLSNPTREQLKQFVKRIEPELNTSDKIFLARRLMNKGAFEEAGRLLDSVNHDELGDQREMILLNLRLRNEIGRNNFKQCDQIILEFPLDEITLSPYILQQCCYIEKSLMNKIKALEANVTSKLHEMKDTMQQTLKNLNGLIGDIEVRLSLDKRDLREKVVEMFLMLDEWIKKTNRDDH
ncbi:hypothetical protein C7M61_002463 [Candidozyma pseudohaemuli]|uniref:Mitochondrial 15S rRNA processing factor CCM1 n=1 Tax=Candidozyma pseudohaemuli TaxID=418784 RepID=A0A2P7YRD8_9ASCO|nr:hypothetical protein C7M61_002463 [[Candida] pseudohaemulonii]PSK38530.1 hypothetical protein C7M61_002463 [[Candida] pseudohaemulonii]